MKTSHRKLQKNVLTLDKKEQDIPSLIVSEECTYFVVGIDISCQSSF
jgi:hypothetical protein